jgi:hypothetical protein
MMNPGADILSLVTGGTTRLTINNSSSTFAGNIYLADGTQRNIIGPTNQTLGIFARPNNASEGIIFSTDGGSTTEMFIQDGGNVGINEDNPDKKLHIVDTSAGAVTYPLRLQNSGTTTGTNVGLIFTTKTSGGGNASCVIRSESEDTSGNNSLVFTTSLGGSTSEKMRITSAGGISFGSTGTAYGTSGQVLTSNGNAVPSWQAAGGSSPWTTSGNNIYNNNSGNVGIGYAAPNAKLHVLGNVILDSYSVSDPDSTSRTAYPAAQMLTHYNEANGVSIIGGVGGYAGTGLTIGEESSRSSSYNFIRGVSDTNGGGNAAEEFWVNGVGGSYFAGDMGIGTTTPNAKLDVQGTQGQLFSVTDSLTGSIFAVSDISGVPILDVNSSGVSYFDGKVGIGQTSPESFWLYNNNLVVGDGSGNNGMAIYSGINDRSTLAFMSTYTSSSGLDFEIRVDHNNSSGFIETSFVGDGNDNWMRFEERQFGQDPIIRIGTNTIYSNTGGSGIGSGAMMQFRPDNNNWYSAIAINAEDGGGNAKGFIEMQSNRSSTYQADYFLKFFNYNASEIGSIRVNSSNNNVAFNTSSDYRLKEDLKEFKALETICKIKVYNYTWKDDPSGFRDQGILAHELDELIPQAVSGEKDAIDKDNKILAQGIDYSKIVPHLVQSIQELKAEIEILKNK